MVVECCCCRLLWDLNLYFVEYGAFVVNMRWLAQLALLNISLVYCYCSLLMSKGLNCRSV